MLGNKKGEVVTLTVLAICLISAVVGMFAMQVPAVKGVLGFKDQKVVNTVKTEPVWLKTPSGEEYLATKEVVSQDSAVPVKAGLVETLKGWLLVLVVLCFIFPSLGIWLLARSKTVTAQIVHGVEEAKQYLTPTAIAALNTSLSKKMDLYGKDLVNAIKADLVKSGEIKTQVVSTPPVIQTPIVSSNTIV